MMHSRGELCRKHDDRFHFLQALVTEFQETSNFKDKQQVLANFGNLAYDPGNYHFFRRLRIIDLFLDMLTGEEDVSLVKFAIHGLCNCSVDPMNRDVIWKSDGFGLIVGTLKYDDDDIVLGALGTLYFIFEPNQGQDDLARILPDKLKHRLSRKLRKTRKKHSKCQQISNIVEVLLERLSSFGDTSIQES